MAFKKSFNTGIISLVICLTMGALGYSQSLEYTRILSLGTTGDSLYAEGYYTAALKIALERHDSILAIPEADSVLLAKSLFRVGELERLCGITSHLTIRLSHAYQIYYRHFGLTDDIAARMCCAYALGLVREIKWDEALTFINTAQNEVEYSNSVSEFSKTLMLWTKGNILHNQRKYEEAEKIYLNCFQRWQDHGSSQTYEYAEALNTLGALYSFTGKFTRSIECHQNCLELCKTIFSEKHAQYGRFLNGLGFAYLLKEELFEASKHCKMALEIIEERLGPTAWYAGIILDNLGTIYLKLGDASSARLFLNKAVNIVVNSSGKNHSDYAMVLSGIASTYQLEGRYKEAKPLLEESLEVSLKALRKNHPYYPSRLAELAKNYLAEGELDTARIYLEQALEILHKIDGPENPSVVEPTQLLVKTHFLLGDYIIADSINKALGIMLDTIWSKRTMDFARNCDYQIKLNFVTDKKDPALVNSAQLSFEVWRTLVLEAAKVASPMELEALLNHLEEHNALIHTVALETGQSELSMNNILMLRNLALESHQNLPAILQYSKEAVRHYAEWRELGRNLSVESSKPIKDQKEEKIAEWNMQSKILEQKIAADYPGFSNSDSIGNWTEIAKALKKGEAAIEFVSYKPLSTNPQSDYIQYAALLMFHNQNPVMVPLFEEKQLLKLLNKTADNPRGNSNLYAATRSGELLDDSPVYGTELYKLIWKPFEQLLREHSIKTVYFSPSGILHRVAFAALPVSKKKTLGIRYQLHQVGSSRNILLKSQEPKTYGYTAALFGAVQYERSKLEQAEFESRENTDNLLWSLVERPRSDGDDGFDYLYGTEREINLLEHILEKKGIPTDVYKGKQASEDVLKSIGRDAGKSPEVLHIATHGFFFPDPKIRTSTGLGENVVFKWNENPLFRSGLAMAGANAAWRGEATPANMEDGIATAYEISQLDLSNTKLAVLSACETGLGDVRGTEGVYGLQRAFKMAGVDHLLVSLWQVPDQETAEFMALFYKSWLGGRTIQQAFSRAQQKMKKRYKEVYKWGAWILIE
ncbi:MAG: CHAT domain-containing tetratricopeptide repeat protein [Saprospiraceae bacterium]